MAYEISKELDYHEVARQTPLAVHRGRSLTGSPGLVCILRASLPFFQGFLNYYDQSDSGFIGAYRKVAEDHEFDISIDYLATASIDGKTLIIADPMLATGGSAIKAIDVLVERGCKPENIIFINIVCVKEGVWIVLQRRARSVHALLISTHVCCRYRGSLCSLSNCPHRY